MTIAITLATLIHLGAPPQHAAGAVLAGMRHGISPCVMGGLLISGHPGMRFSGRCGDHGTTCGAWRIHQMWPRRWGYTLADRNHWYYGADMAARLALYSQRRHERCEGEHDWRAHMKASSGARDGPRAAWKVRRQLAAERRVCWWL